MEQIRLDIIPKGLMPVCHSSQYDKGRVIRLNLVDGLQGYTLTDETVTLNVRKPDNNIVTAGVNVVSGASYVDIVTTEQMTACEGENLCEIVITKGDVKIASLNFKMKVEADPLKDGVESETVIHDLKTTISDMVKEEIEAISPEEELSGAMASFETHEIAPLVDCKVKIEAIQSGSGTPSPDNVRTITGFTECNVSVSGVNLWDEDYALGFWTNNGVFSPSTSGYMSSKTHIPVKPNTSICVVIPNNILFYLCRYDINKNFIDRLTLANPSQRIVQMTSETCYITFSTYQSYGTTYNNDISINYPSTDTTYHKGASTTTTISLGQTVYGGELDVTSGKLTVTHVGYVVDGTRTIAMSTANRFYIQIPNAFKVDSTNQTTYSGVRSEILSPTTWAGLGSGSGNLKCAPLYGNGIAFRDDEKTTVADWVTYFTNNPTIFTYELATPQTIQLTPTEIKTILGVNNIWADTGDIDVVYHHELTARYVYFDNTGTDLTATNVEAAIKELWSRLQ